MHDEPDQSDVDDAHPPPRVRDETPPALLELFGGSAELVALADEDANELLRFVESTMTEDEAAGFIARVEHRDPLAAMRLVRMRDDHRLLRTTGEVPIGRDLLGPVRARVARGELVADSNFASGSAEPTEFMERSLASLARRRRRAKRRPVQVVGGLLIVAGVLMLAIWFRQGLPPSARSDGSLASGAGVEADPAGYALASFGLVVPTADPERAETELALVAVERGAVLLRNLELGPGNSGQPPPIVGVLARDIPRSWREELAEGGFEFVVVAPRNEVPAILAEIGSTASRDEVAARPRLVPVSGGVAAASADEDAWKSWSTRSQAIVSEDAPPTLLVVPIGLLSVEDAGPTVP